MERDDNCTCGHRYDDHRQDANGPHECEIVDCDCSMFEEEEEDEDED